MKLLLLSFLFVSFLSAQNSNDNFTQFFSDYSKSINEKNLDKLLTFFDESYIGYYPNEPDQNYEGIKEQYRKIFQNKNLKATVTCDILDGDSNESFSFVQIVFSWTFKSTFSSQPMNAADNGLLILKRDKSGNWKITRSSLMPGQTGPRQTKP